MRITILTLFPEVFEPIFSTSIPKKAKEKGFVMIDIVNIRNYAEDSYKTVDDKPYGGGTGMIMRVDILHKALLAQDTGLPAGRQGYRIYLAPHGARYTQKKAKELAKKEHLILICGHYEGVDARIEDYADEIISIGDYVLTGGEIPAMVLVDSIVRLLPGVLKSEATKHESFEHDLFEYPQYTRPQEFRGKKVPSVLLSGNHKKIEEWRKGKQRKIEG